MTTTAEAPTLLERLLLQAAREFEFVGGDQDEGIWVRVTQDLAESSEGNWCLIRHYCEGYAWHQPPLTHSGLQPRILVEFDGDDHPGFFWAPWSPTTPLPQQLLPMGYTNLHRACEQALRACQVDDVPEVNFKLVRYYDKGGNKFQRLDRAHVTDEGVGARDLSAGDLVMINGKPPVLVYDVGCDGPIPQVPHIVIAELEFPAPRA